MKRSLLIITGAMFTVAPGSKAFAMGGGGGGGGGGGIPNAGRYQPAVTVTEKLAKALDLTPEQVKKVRSIMESVRVAVNGDRADKSLTAEQRIEKFRQDREYAASRIHELLNESQQARWVKLRKNWSDWGQG